MERSREVIDIVPEIVTYDKDNDRYGIDYGHAVGLLVEAIKELNNKVENLEKKIKNGD
jgi:hypothetical protein